MPISLRWQRLELPDGDFVDLSWADSAHSTPKGIAVLFHGLEGSARSHYANDMLAVLAKDGWQAVMMHFRSCGNGLNRLPRAYHSGDTGDAIYFLGWLERHFPQMTKVALGFSLGANMLLKLLGENPTQKWLKSAVCISPPFRLAECADSISKGFSNNYQKYLMRSMVAKLREKMRYLDFRPWLKITDVELSSLATFKDFDQSVTAPLHGFADVDDYYEQCSAIRFTPGIHTPTLILHSTDDPFMNNQTLPQAGELSQHVTLELSSKGGHVGFMAGMPWKPTIWTHQRVPEFLNGFK